MCYICYVSDYWHSATINRLVHWGEAASASVTTLMGDRNSMSTSVDSPLDETLKRGPLGLLLRRQYEFTFGINIVQFSFSCMLYLLCVIVYLTPVV